MKDVPLKVQASSTCQRLIGIGLTLAGLLLTIFISALARPGMARLQAQRAAAALRQSISQFESELAELVPAEVPTPTMKAVASRLTQSISEQELDRKALLPPTPDADVTAAALKPSLDKVSETLEGLQVLLRSGFPALLRILPTNRKTALALIQQLDLFADSVSGRQDARGKVGEVHKQIPTATQELAQRPLAREGSVGDLDLRIEKLSRVGWATWALIALAVAAAWIVIDPDYGTALDLVSSFLWGFGVTTFGAGIQNLTPASVATQMNVKLPK